MSDKMDHKERVRDLMEGFHFDEWEEVSRGHLQERLLGMLKAVEDATIKDFKLLDDILPPSPGTCGECKHAVDVGFQFVCHNLKAPIAYIDKGRHKDFGCNCFEKEGDDANNNR